MWLALGMQAHIALRMAMYIAVAVSVFPVQSQQQPHDTSQLPAADIYPRAFWAVQHIRLLTLFFFFCIRLISIQLFNQQILHTYSSGIFS